MKQMFPFKITYTVGNSLWNDPERLYARIAYLLENSAPSRNGFERQEWDQIEKLFPLETEIVRRMILLEKRTEINYSNQGDIRNRLNILEKKLLPN